MPDIIIIFTCLSQYLAPTTLRQLRRVTEAMLSMTGRVTMKGLSRWTGPGGSYRTVQRFFHTSISWCKLQWVLIRHHLLEPDDVIVMGGDEVVVTKAGKQTYGLDRFFSLAVWQSCSGAVFSEFIPDQRQTPHLLSGHDGTNGQKAQRRSSGGGKENLPWETGTTARQQKSESTSGRVVTRSPFRPRDHYALPAVDW
jgi:DDE superfamily endonuclease